MSIKIGQKLPDSTLYKLGKSGPETTKLSSLYTNRKLAIFALPGAFTPTCSTSHLPTIIEAAAGFYKKGIDEILCVSVNDPHVVAAWGEISGSTAAGITMLGDPTSEFTKSIGAEIDRTEKGLGMRSARYTMLIDNNVIKSIKAEEDTAACEISAAENFIKEI